ncbi:cysteine-rich receptor-like protein kinase 8 [Artemisia annua]|uniref:Cysteine-rich receptor-like protein kinase 8 n=1 Tax=Artemisia annua TaxID=35608 RepID=A0A2U1P0P1_ARTAN|nr:cysteine-rich receptor-like protein kinase 8 [Artemisia annua]
MLYHLSHLIDTSIRYSFYNRSVGQNPDQANAIGLCKGDVEPEDCRRCLNDAITQLRQICPNQKGAIGWYDNCMLKYSNATIFGVLDTSFRWDMFNTRNASNVAGFNQALDLLLDQLRNDASRGGSLRKYASNSTSGPDFTTLYGLMQCTPDLSEIDCYNCLDRAIRQIPNCCDSKRGARIYYPSCNMRYEEDRFYNDTVALSSPPMPPSGKSSNTTIVVIVVVASVSFLILAAVLLMVLIRRKRNIQVRPPENLVYEDGDIDDISTAESLQYSFDIIKEATDNFSENNKLGQGGFGLVYKIRDDVLCFVIGDYESAVPLHRWGKCAMDLGGDLMKEATSVVDKELKTWRVAREVTARWIGRRQLRVDNIALLESKTN